VSITRRFIGLLALGLIPLGISMIVQGSLTVFLLYNLLCGGLLLWDFIISKDGEALAVERTGSEVLSIYEQEAIGFQITNPARRSLSFHLKDDVPDFHFQCEYRGMTGQLEANSRGSFSRYTVRRSHHAAKPANLTRHTFATPGRRPRA